MARLRRSNPYDPPTLLDTLLTSPLKLLIEYVYAILLVFRGASFKPPRNKPAIKFVCISDSHFHTPNIPTGDVLVHAGDMTNSGTLQDIQAQLDWLESLPGFKHKIVIAGNHDSYFDPKSRLDADKGSGKKPNFHSIHYLQNQALQLKFRGGRTLNFYGASDIPKCGGSEMAFQYNRDSPPWKNRIPISTDVLITHTPPKHHLDIGLGCDGLLEEIWRVKPRLHIFGHIHSGHGKEQVWWDQGQLAYERLLNRKNTGIVRDCIPSSAWLDALKVVWYGVRGILWQYLMAGPRGGNGGLLVNAALVYQSTLELKNQAEVVEL